MIYTTYFAGIRTLPSTVIPVSICGKPPAGYHGAQLKLLAPKYSFFSVWKETHDNEYYIEHYKKEVLDCLDPQKIVEMLYALSDGKDVALVCYEKPSDFCHRHLVSEWLTANGFPCEEFSVQVSVRRL